MPPAGVPSVEPPPAGVAGAVAVVDGLADSPGVLAGSPAPLSGRSPEEGVVAGAAVVDSADAVLVTSGVDGSADVEDTEDDGTAVDPPPDGSTEPVAEAWTGVLNAALLRAGSTRGRTLRKRRALVGTVSMPSFTACEITRSLAASSESSMLSAAFSRCSRASCSSARPIPAFSLSSPSWSVTIPISANATRAIQVLPPSERRLPRRSIPASTPSAMPSLPSERRRAGRSPMPRRSSPRRAGPETRRGRGTTSGRAGAVVRRGRTAGAAAVARALTPGPRPRSASWRRAAAPRRRGDCARSPPRRARSSDA